MKPAQTQLKVLKGYQASAPAVSKGLPRTCRAAPRQRAQGLQQQNPRGSGPASKPNRTELRTRRAAPSEQNGPGYPRERLRAAQGPLPCAQGGAAGEGPGRASPEERRPPRPPRPRPGPRAAPVGRQRRRVRSAAEGRPGPARPPRLLPGPAAARPGPGYLAGP